MLFASREFAYFAQFCNIAVTTSSPEYPTSIGETERCVETMKNIISKANEYNRNSYFAWLECRNIISGLKYVPAQVLVSRLLRSKIPEK